MNQEAYTSILVTSAFLALDAPESHGDWIALFLVIPLCGWALGRFLRLIGCEVQDND